MGAVFWVRIATLGQIKLAAMPDLVAPDIERYAKTAITLASDARLLEGIRARLAKNKTSAPLFDIDRYVKNLEAAYDDVWQTYVTEKLQRA